MPKFEHPFAGLANDPKLTKSELIRAIRYSIAAEYEAIQLYIQLAGSTDNIEAQKVLKDVADEERVHTGEFLQLLYRLPWCVRSAYALRKSTAVSINRVLICVVFLCLLVLSSLVQSCVRLSGVLSLGGLLVTF